MKIFRMAAAVATATACSAALLVSPASADDGRRRPSGSPITVVADGLSGPYEISQTKKALYVTESDAGRVLAIDKKTKRSRVVISGLGQNTATGAVRVGNRIAIVTGEREPGQQAPVPGSSLLVAKPGGTPRQFADLLKYELRYNPDRQRQFGPDGQPLDALSNPFYVLEDTKTRNGFVLVADGGANAVLRVDRRGRISTFFVPPTINTGACEGLPNNTGTVGCDSVPTGLAYGPGNTLYVSALTAEVPGEGRVYVLNAKTGKLKRVITGFTSPTGVAVKRNGTVYVSELIEGAPAPGGPPPPNFDPSTIGRLVKVDRSGDRSVAQLPMPLGVLVDGKRLYSTTWSIAGFFGLADKGQVVRVDDRAFGDSTGRDGKRTRYGVGDQMTLRGPR